MDPSPLLSTLLTHRSGIEYMAPSSWQSDFSSDNLLQFWYPVPVLAPCSDFGYSTSIHQSISTPERLLLDLCCVEGPSIPYRFHELWADHWSYPSQEACSENQGPLSPGSIMQLTRELMCCWPQSVQQLRALMDAQKGSLKNTEVDKKTFCWCASSLNAYFALVMNANPTRARHLNTLNSTRWWMRLRDTWKDLHLVNQPHVHILNARLWPWSCWVWCIQDSYCKGTSDIPLRPS